MRENRLNRQPSGPGRSTRRPRPSASDPRTPTSTDATRTTGSRPVPASPVRNSALARAAARIPRPPRNLSASRRILVLVAVLAVLALSFASSVWMLQSQELAAAQAQIERDQARVAELESSLERWGDPAYVRAQARERLGWVMPGEVGYRVLGRDGEVLSGSTEIEGVGTPQANPLAARWWDKLATSVHHADRAPLLADPPSTAEAPDPLTQAAPPDQPAGR